MDLRLLLQALVISAALASCGGLENAGYGPDDPFSTATAGDMANILGDTEAAGPYSRYLYRIVETDGREGGSGIVSIARGGDENMRLVVSGAELKVVPGRSYDLDMAGSDRVPFSGGYAAGGRLAIIPGVYTPVEFRPSWFPSVMDLSVDQNCNLLVQTKKQYVNETQKLVAFMDARNRLEGLKCEILGTFDTMPQLKKLVTRLRKEGKYKDERHYVLRLSWSSTFALVTIAREGGKP
jgi:hypothetical protein